VRDAAKGQKLEVSGRPAALSLVEAREDLLRGLAQMVGGHGRRSGHTLVIGWRGRVLAIDVRAANVAEIWCLQHRRASGAQPSGRPTADD